MNSDIFNTSITQTSSYLALFVTLAGVFVGVIAGVAVHAWYSEKQQDKLIAAMQENYDNVLQFVRLSGGKK